MKKSLGCASPRNRIRRRRPIRSAPHDHALHH
jgi:hypothetical protein